MTMGVFDFKSIRQKLERQEQKAEFEVKNPKPDPAMYGWPYGGVTPYAIMGDGLYWIDASGTVREVKI
jgi:hypothetical protein